MKPVVLLSLGALLLGTTLARATFNYAYGVDEYVTISAGISPVGKYAITTHGEGDDGYTNFHVYLTNAVTGKKVGPLEEIVNTLDTGAGAFCAQWSKDSQYVTIIYRIDRHEPLKVMSYRLGHGRAFPQTAAPVDATDAQTTYWGSKSSDPLPPAKIFGTSKPQ